jgi:DNA-binding response OmpR family regulator
MEQNITQPLVLIVDHEDNTRKFLRVVFEREGFRVESVATGLMAIKAADLKAPNVIVLNVRLRGISGFEVLRRIRSNDRTAKIPTIMMGGEREARGRALAKELDAELIYKPFAPTDLMSLVYMTLRAARMKELEVSLEAQQSISKDLEMRLAAVSAEKLQIEQKSVFISYRRSTTMHLARLVFQELKTHNYNVFLDVDTLDNGVFDRILLSQIVARAHFILVLSSGALARCVEEGDWLRREIEEAIGSARNIVPLLDVGFNIEEEKLYLPEPIRTELFRRNAVPYSHDYPEAAFEKMRRFLKEPRYVDLVPTPIDDLAEVQRRVEAALRVIPPQADE